MEADIMVSTLFSLGSIYKEFEDSYKDIMFRNWHRCTTERKREEQIKKKKEKHPGKIALCYMGHI